MDNIIVQKLIARGGIRQGTEIEVHHYAYGLSCASTTDLVGAFIIDRAIRLPGGEIAFEAAGGNPYGLYRFKAGDILKIDGMDIARFCAIHQMEADGEDVTVGKRRGRRPKHFVPRSNQPEQYVWIAFEQDDDEEDAAPSAASGQNVEEMSMTTQSEAVTDEDDGVWLCFEEDEPVASAQMPVVSEIVVETVHEDHAEPALVEEMSHLAAAQDDGVGITFD